jgi:hypothetical protein
MRKTMTLALTGLALAGMSGAASAQSMGLTSSDFQREKDSVVQSLGAQQPTAEFKIRPAMAVDPLTALSAGSSAPATSSQLGAQGMAMTAPMGPSSGASISMAVPHQITSGLSAASNSGEPQRNALSSQAASLPQAMGAAPVLGLGGATDASASLGALAPHDAAPLGSR